MRTQVMAAAALFVLTTLGTAQDAPAGKYVSKEGGFTVVFPGGGDVKVKNQDAPGGLKMTMVGVESPSKAYMVMYMEFPEAILKAAPADLILDGAAKGASAKASGTELSSKKIAFGKAKYPGREVVIDKDGKIARTQMILAETRLYVLVAGGEKDEVMGKTGDGFFKSFELAPGKKAVVKD